MPKIDFEQIILDSEAYELLTQLDSFRKHIKANIPDEVLFTHEGEYNYRNRYGAMLTQVAALTCTLRTFVK